MEQIKAVVPLAAYLFSISTLNSQTAHFFFNNNLSWIDCGNIGLAIFMEGLKQDLMPFGNVIGDTLPKRAPMFLF